MTGLNGRFSSVLSGIRTLRHYGSITSTSLYGLTGTLARLAAFGYSKARSATLLTGALTQTYTLERAVTGFTGIFYGIVYGVKLGGALVTGIAGTFSGAVERLAELARTASGVGLSLAGALVRNIAVAKSVESSLGVLSGALSYVVTYFTALTETIEGFITMSGEVIRSYVLGRSLTAGFGLSGVVVISSSTAPVNHVRSVSGSINWWFGDNEDSYREILYYGPANP